MPTYATAPTFRASRNGPKKSGFLTLVPAKTGIFLRSFNLGKKFHTSVCILSLSRIIVAKLSLKKCVVTPNFLFGFQLLALAKICFSRVVINRAKYFDINRHRP